MPCNQDDYTLHKTAPPLGARATQPLRIILASAGTAGTPFNLVLSRLSIQPSKEVNDVRYSCSWHLVEF